MKKLYCVIWGKYRQFEITKISYDLEKIVILSIIFAKCKNEDEKFLRRRIDWDITNSWFNWKYIITLKICLKKPSVKNSD